MTKCLGLIGGSSASGTALMTDYLREETEDKLGCGNAPELITYSLNPQEMRLHLQGDEWPRLAARLAPGVRGMVTASAQALVLGSSSLQVIGAQFAEQTGLPIFGMIEPVIEEARRHEVRCLALVGTRWRSEEEIWRTQLRAAGIELSLPLRNDRSLVTTMIDHELAYGHCREPSRVDLMRLLLALGSGGSQGVVFTRPELSLLSDPADCKLPVWSGPRLCARHVIRWAMLAENGRTKASQ